MSLAIKWMAASLALAASTALYAQTDVGVAPQPPGQAAAQAGATAGTMADIGARFAERFPGVTVTEVTPTPFEGLYEIRIGMDLFYADANVDFLIQGSLIDAQSRKDLTAERLRDLSRIDFSALPLERAIALVKGDGSRKVAVFEDPNCPYCKRFHETLKDVDNVTVYSFLFPILSDDSRQLSQDIWCADDQATAWRDWMLNDERPAQAQCDTPLDANLALGRELGVRGTPAVFFQDGTRVNGAMPLEALEAKLKESAAQQG